MTDSVPYAATSLPTRVCTASHMPLCPPTSVCVTRASTSPFQALEYLPVCPAVPAAVSATVQATPGVLYVQQESTYPVLRPLPVSVPTATISICPQDAVCRVVGFAKHVIRLEGVLPVKPIARCSRVGVDVMRAIMGLRRAV